MAWPPKLPALKEDLSIRDSDTRDDVRLQTVLDAAVVKVQELREGDFNFDVEDLDSDLPPPTADVELGTIRLAARWHARRRSLDALINLGDLGSARVPAFDTDIEQLLGVGRFRGPVIA